MLSVSLILPVSVAKGRDRIYKTDTGVTTDRHVHDGGSPEHIGTEARRPGSCQKISKINSTLQQLVLYY